MWLKTRNLILIRHSQPEILPGVPAARWRLSEAGRARTCQLAERLAAYRPVRVFSSQEPKARETAILAARAWHCPLELGVGLHEHERTAQSYLDRSEFQAGVAGLFARPGELVFGSESADQAHARFAAAIAGLVERYPDGNLAVVAHGTVIALFVARANGLDPFPLWQRLGLPSWAVLSLPELRLLSITENLEATV